MYDRRTFHLDESKQEISTHEGDVSDNSMSCYSVKLAESKTCSFVCIVGGRNVNSLFTPILVAE